MMKFLLNLDVGHYYFYTYLYMNSSVITEVYNFYYNNITLNLTYGSFGYITCTKNYLDINRNKLSDKDVFNFQILTSSSLAQTIDNCIDFEYDLHKDTILVLT